MKSLSIEDEIELMNDTIDSAISCRGDSGGSYQIRPIKEIDNRKSARMEIFREKKDKIEYKIHSGSKYGCLVEIDTRVALIEGESRHYLCEESILGDS